MMLSCGGCYCDSPILEEVKPRLYCSTFEQDKYGSTSLIRMALSANTPTIALIFS